MTLGNSVTLFLIIVAVGASILGVRSVRIVCWRGLPQEDPEVKKIWSAAKFVAMITGAAIAAILLARVLYNLSNLHVR